MEASRRDFLRAGSLAAAFSPVAKAAGPAPIQIGNDQINLTFEVAAGRAMRMPAMRNKATGFTWTGTSGAASLVFSSAALREPTGLVHSWKANKSRVDLEYQLDGGVKAGQHFSAVAGMPVVKCGAHFQNATSQPIERADSIGFKIPLRAALGPLEVYCAGRATYAIQRIPFQNKLELTGGGWNQPEYAGLLALHAMESKELLLVGFEWERGWRYRLFQDQGTVWLQMEACDLKHTLAPDESIAMPGLFLCAVHGDADDAFRYAQRYLRAHVAPKTLPNWPWVVYDIWGTEAQGVEQVILDEIEPSAALGIELFYVDAAWYQGSSKKGNGDWGCGLGNYAEDREKFPRGLAHVSERVHASGMKFGLWVGPNIVDARLVPDKIPRRWVAQKDGADRVLTIPKWESPCLQVCLGCPEYIDYLKRNLSRIVQEFGLDWLKWDNSGIPGSPGLCNRADHGHQAGDGSYAAMLGTYEIFDHLHRGFPNLVLEQCGYGSRLDLGIAPSIRANWLSDASFPSTHVRHNALVASYIYPSSYNGAWVLRDKELEETKDPALMDSIYRSRMMGLFGFGTLNGTLPERVSQFPAEALAAARRNIPVFKRYRHLLQFDAYHPFPPAGSAEGWQSVQFNSEDARQAVVLCFRNGSRQASMRVPLKGLNPGLKYDIVSANGSEFTAAPGSALLREGLIVRLDKPEMSDVLLLNI